MENEVMPRGRKAPAFGATVSAAAAAAQRRSARPRAGGRWRGRPPQSRRPLRTISALMQSPSSAPSDSDDAWTAARRAEELADRRFDESAASFLLSIPMRKLLTWSACGALLYFLRSFLPVAMLTFIIGYGANSFVRWVQRRSALRLPRKAIVATFYALIVSFVSSIGFIVVPTVIREAQYFVRTLQSSNPYVFVADGIRSSLGDEVSERVEQLLLTTEAARRLPDAPPLPLGAAAAEVSLAGAESAADAGARSVASALAASPPPVAWTEERSRRLGFLLQQTLRPYALSTAALITRLLGQTTRVLFTAVVALVFSAMVMWDLPQLAGVCERLERSRIRWAYREVAPYVREFARVLGRSFEAQGMIALVNTSLSMLGMLALRLNGVGFLTLVVLLCSFIPVAGVFLSTAPMLVVALSEYGLSKALAVIVMVAVVHAVEAYLLNPQIYSTHLKLHPLFVLVVLYMWEHLSGPLGLLVAVPITVYIVRFLLLGISSSSRPPPPDGGGDDGGGERAEKSAAAAQ